MNYTIVYQTYAVSPLCLLYDSKQQTASAAIITPALFLAYKSVLLQIADSTFYSTDRQIQFPCNSYRLPDNKCLPYSHDPLSTDIPPPPYGTVLLHIFLFCSTNHLILCSEYLSYLCHCFIHPRL